MRENYRKPIASIEKLPRFTTMNVIDGQAGLAIYASLIFYSLTIDNILNIIVLLILAGVAISMLSGENGILRQAAKAKTETEKAAEEEAIRLATIAAMTNPEHKISNFQEELDKQLGEGKARATQKNGVYTVTIGEKEYRVDSNGEVGEIVNIDDATTATNKNRAVKDANEETFVMPANFKLSKNEDGTIIEDEITKGIVIEDSEANQYVWIPVFEYDATNCTWGVDYSAVTSEDDWVNIEKALINTTSGYTKTYRNSSYSDVWYGDASYGKYGYYDGEKFVYYTNGNMTKTEYETLYHNMLKSIYKNGGFYIGRYEMGTAVVNSTTEAQSNTRTKVNEYTPSTTTSGTTTNTAAAVKIGAKPVIKANAVPYNYIIQSQAQMLAESLNYSSVKSSLMFGVQWDIVCVFLEHYGKVDSSAKNNAGASFTSSYLTSNNYSKYWGNYSNSTFNMNRGYYNIYNRSFRGWTAAAEKTSTRETWLCTTGASNQNSSLNIYDFAGNEYEWTLERYSSSYYPCVLRGGDFSYDNYASDRYYTSTYVAYEHYSARPSLYVK